MILVCKGTCAPVAPFQGAGRQCPRNAPPFRRPCLFPTMFGKNEQSFVFRNWLWKSGNSVFRSG